MIFVVFFVPLAVYLLILGHINRGPRPVIVSGTWDFVGILFAASGFLLAGGPAILTAFDERWRMFWLVAERARFVGPALPGVLLAVVYFLVVVIGCIVVFVRRRQLTCIYNVEPAEVENALLESCQHLGLDPIHSGNLLVFGLSLDGPALSAAGQNAILEMEPFTAGMHVTLRWDPHDSPLRPALEAELDRRLVLRGAPEHDTGTWLSLAGFGLLAVSVVIMFVAVLWNVLRR